MHYGTKIKWENQRAKLATEKWYAPARMNIRSNNEMTGKTDITDNNL